MKLNWLSGYPQDLIRDVNFVKEASGVRCTDVLEWPVVETATQKKVATFYEVIFEGGPIKLWKARRALEQLKSMR